MRFDILWAMENNKRLPDLLQALFILFSVVPLVGAAHMIVSPILNVMLHIDPVEPT
jgi:hypothetical protein